MVCSKGQGKSCYRVEMHTDTQWQPAGTHLMVLSEDPLTTSRSLYCRQAMPRLCPLRVRTNSHVLVLQTYGTREGCFFENCAQWRLLTSNRSCYKLTSRSLRLTFAGQQNENFHSIFTGKGHVVLVEDGITEPSNDKSHWLCYCAPRQWERLYFQVVDTGPNNLEGLMALESW